jgi:hypothetical protein
VRRRPGMGLAVLINNRAFYTKDFREGAEHDLENLNSLFTKLNFDVKPYNDLPSTVSIRLQNCLILMTVLDKSHCLSLKRKHMLFKCALTIGV